MKVMNQNQRWLDPWFLTFLVVIIMSSAGNCVGLSGIEHAVRKQNIKCNCECGI